MPTFRRAGGYVLYGFSYNALSNRWAFASTNQTTDYGTAGFVQTANGPGVEPSWQPSARGRGGTGERLLPITAVDFPATDPAILSRDTNGTAVLRFDNAVPVYFLGAISDECGLCLVPCLQIAVFDGVCDGSLYMVIDVSVMAITPGVDSHNPDIDANYGTANTCTDAVPGTAKTPKRVKLSPHQQ